MTGDLGPDWESRFQSFDPKPFAAASIGQVHMATLLDGTQVCIIHILALLKLVYRGGIYTTESHGYAS